MTKTGRPSIVGVINRKPLGQIWTTRRVILLFSVCHKKGCGGSSNRLCQQAALGTFGRKTLAIHSSLQLSFPGKQVASHLVLYTPYSTLAKQAGQLLQSRPQQCAIMKSISSPWPANFHFLLKQRGATLTCRRQLKWMEHVWEDLGISLLNKSVFQLNFL